MWPNSLSLAWKEREVDLVGVQDKAGLFLFYFEG